MARPSVRKDPLIAQNCQMLGEVGLGYTQLLGQNPHTLLPFGQDFKKMDPDRMTQDPETPGSYRDLLIHGLIYILHNIMILEY